MYLEYNPGSVIVQLLNQSGHCVLRNIESFHRDNLTLHQNHLTLQYEFSIICIIKLICVLQFPKYWRMKSIFLVFGLLAFFLIEVESRPQVNFIVWTQHVLFFFTYIGLQTDQVMVLSQKKYDIKCRLNMNHLLI